MTLGDTWVNCGGSAGNVSQSLARDIGLQGEFKGDDHRAERFQLCALLEMPVGCLRSREAKGVGDPKDSLWTSICLELVVFYLFHTLEIHLIIELKKKRILMIEIS